MCFNLITDKEGKLLSTKSTKKKRVWCSGRLQVSQWNLSDAKWFLPKNSTIPGDNNCLCAIDFNAKKIKLIEQNFFQINYMHCHR